MNCVDSTYISYMFSCSSILFRKYPISGVHMKIWWMPNQFSIKLLFWCGFSGLLFICWSNFQTFERKNVLVDRNSNSRTFRPWYANKFLKMYECLSYLYSLHFKYDITLVNKTDSSFIVIFPLIWRLTTNPNLFGRVSDFSINLMNTILNRLQTGTGNLARQITQISAASDLFQSKWQSKKLSDWNPRSIRGKERRNRHDRARMNRLRFV